MAGRFVFQKLAASGMTRSTSRLVGAQASASFSRATAPVMPRASEDGITTLSRFFHAAAVHPGGNNVVPRLPAALANHGGGIRAYGSPVLAKIRRLKARMSPSINNHDKSSALVDSFVGEVKQTCSPDASNDLKLLVDWATKKIKGLNRHEIFLLKFFVWCNLMVTGIVLIACSEDVSTSSSSSRVPSQSLHCSGCNCHSCR